MSAIARRIGVTAAMAMAIAAVVGSVYLFHTLRRDTPAGVVRAPLDRPDDWKEYGGTWQYVNGVMRNISDERGAMLINDSAGWSNYSVEADVLLLGQYGDAGLILRASDEEEGVDAYYGYMAGLRDLDSALILGRADYGWREFVAKNIKPSVQGQQWYHVKFLAYNCDFAVAATTPAGETVSAAIEDPDCHRTGHFGLKSYNTGAEWSNVVVRPASAQDLAAMTGGTKPPRAQPDEFPFGSVSEPGERYFEPLRRDLEAHQSDVNARPIGSLRLLPPDVSTRATVRGVVTLTSPTLYVQDSSGGLAIPAPRMASPVGIGDEIEAQGEVIAHDFSSELLHAEVRPLWSHTPVLPVVVTAYQAATGAFDGEYIEMEGVLQQTLQEAGNRQVLILDEGSQSFLAIAAGEPAGTRFKNLKPKSRLRLRGICVVDPTYTRDQTSFAILLPSLRDVEVLSGPPWWTAGHIAALIVAVLVTILLALVTYIRIERWRMRAVLEERQRLAHDMHDTLAQSFAGLGFQLEAMQGELQEGGDVAPQLRAAREMVRNSHEEARRSLAALRPEHLESVGLLEALKSCATRMMNGKGSVAVEISSRGSERTIPLRLADTFLRIGQEAIANAVRHAHPRHLRISLEYARNTVELQVADDGKGFHLSSEKTGFGIRGMRKRADGIGATLTLESVIHKGTVVRVRGSLPPSFPMAAWRALKMIHPVARRKS